LEAFVVVVVTLHFVAIIVNEGRIPVDDLSSHTGIFNRLSGSTLAG
jgi:hypothetical protein